MHLECAEKTDFFSGRSSNRVVFRTSQHSCEARSVSRTELAGV
jgi:hypothetical protein